MQQKALKREQTKKKWPHCLPFDESKKNLTEKKNRLGNLPLSPTPKHTCFHLTARETPMERWDGAVCYVFCFNEKNVEGCGELFWGLLEMWLVL